jgi:hypothetical protein
MRVVQVKSSFAAVIFPLHFSSYHLSLMLIHRKTINRWVIYYTYRVGRRICFYLSCCRRRRKNVGKILRNKASGWSLVIFIINLGGSEIFKEVVCHLSECDELCCGAFQTLSMIWCANWMSRANRLIYCTTLPRTLKPSSHFKLALCEGILPCLEMWNLCQRHLCVCTIDWVWSVFSLQTHLDSLASSLWLLTSVCVQQQLVPSRLPVAHNNGMKDVMLSCPTL